MTLYAYPLNELICAGLLKFVVEEFAAAHHHPTVLVLFSFILIVSEPVNIIVTDKL